MLKKSFVLAIVIAVALSFAIAAGVVIASDKGPEEMVLKTDAAKKPALFPHAKHQKMEGATCAECHHSKGADGKQAAYVDGQKIEQCVTCHNADMPNETLNSFKKAAHINCKDCHKTKAAEGLAAPTKCAGCHPKDLK